MAPKSRPKRARRTYTPEQREEVLEHYQQHGTAAASKHFNIPKSTINSWARSSGIRTVRNEKTEAATKAAEIDAAAVRAEASNFAIQGARAAFKILNERIEREGNLVNLKDLGIVTGILADKHLAFKAVEVDTGATDAASMLDRLFDQLGGDTADDS